MKVGDKVYWKKNPVDVYTIERFGYDPHPEGFARYGGPVYALITNVHGHEVKVAPAEIYPYKEAK